MSLKEQWANLDPSTRRYATIGGVAATLIGVLYGVSPEPTPIQRGEEATISHLLTDEDTQKVTLQNLAAKMDNLRAENQKLQRQVDRLNSDIRSDNGPSGNGNTRLEKDVAQVMSKLREIERKATLSNRRLDNIEDTGLALSTDAIEKTVQQMAENMDFGSNSSLQGGAGLPVVPAMPMMPLGGTAAPVDVDKPLATEVEKEPPTEVEFEVTDDASDFFKEAPVPKRKSVSARAGVNGNMDEGANVPRQLVGRTIASGDVSSSTIEAKEKQVTLQRAKENQSEKKDGETIYLPSGSMLEGVLMSGMDAPTEKAAKSNPFPSLIRFKKEAVLPNKFSADVRECFGVAAGYGDLSSSRAYLRLESISCVRKDGGVVESRMDAWAVGEDSKSGIRGRLVSKEGQLISKALMAGFMEGMAKAFDTAAVPTIRTLSTSGEPVPFQDVLSDKAAQSGLMGGASNAAGKIAEYWLEMAEGIKPVIEIDAGRSVTFIVNRGVTLKLL